MFDSKTVSARLRIPKVTPDSKEPLSKAGVYMCASLRICWLSDFKNVGGREVGGVVLMGNTCAPHG